MVVEAVAAILAMVVETVAVAMAADTLVAVAVLAGIPVMVAMVDLVIQLALQEMVRPATVAEAVADQEAD